MTISKPLSPADEAARLAFYGVKSADVIGASEPVAPKAPRTLTTKAVNVPKTVQSPTDGETFYLVAVTGVDVDLLIVVDATKSSRARRAAKQLAKAEGLDITNLKFNAFKA